MMQTRLIRAAAIAGALGALVLFGIQIGLRYAGYGDPFVGVVVAIKILRMLSPPGPTALAALATGDVLFCLDGAAWGALYGLLMPKITPLSGLLFSLAPTLFLLVVMLPLLGHPAFAGGYPEGILIPLVLNSI